MHRGFRRKTRLAEQLSEERVGFSVLRIRVERGACRGKSLAEEARGLQGARFGVTGPRHCLNLPRVGALVAVKG
jgi:hypothetical protein